MSTFQSVKIKSVCEKVASGGTPSRKRADYFTDTGGHLWVKSKELLEKGITDTEEKITEEGLQNSSAKFYPADTVLVAMYGVNAGQLGWLEKPATVNQAICALVVDPKKADWRFVYYSLLQSRQNLISQARGGAQPNLNKEMVENFEIPMTSDLPTQTRIASVLSAYDELIENNEKRIKALEEMAQLLYTEWFVKFKFPGHEKVKLIDSGSEYGKIPEGWEVVTIGSLLSTVKRKTKTQTDEYLLTGKYPIVDQGREFIAGYTDDEKTVYDQDLVVFGDHSRCFKYCNFPFACGADGTQLLLTNDSERMPEVLLYYVSINSGLQNYNYARHFKFLKSLQVIKPDTLSAKRFKDVVKEAYIQIKVLRDKNLILSKTRDLLIPQLVTGKRELK